MTSLVPNWAKTQTIILRDIFSVLTTSSHCLHIKKCKNFRMNQLLSNRKARFIMLRDGRRSLSISANLFGNNRVMAKQKRTVDVTKPVSYTEVPQTLVKISSIFSDKFAGIIFST